MINVGSTGAAGRRGRALIEAVTEAQGMTVAAAIERPASSVIAADAGEVAGIGKLNVPIVDDLRAVVSDIDVLIDFTHILLSPLSTLNPVNMQASVSLLVPPALPMKKNNALARQLKISAWFLPPT